MKLRSILASLALVLVASTQAQPRDEVLLDMQQAFQQGKQERLTLLLPQAIMLQVGRQANFPMASALSMVLMLVVSGAFLLTARRLRMERV